MRFPRPTSGAPVSLVFPILAFLVLVLAAYANPLFTRRSFLGRDLVPYNLPLEKAVHDAWSRGRLPVWFPDASGGRPLMPNPNSGVLYPVRPVLSLVPFPLAMRLFPVLHWAGAGVGMILLLGALGASSGGAFVGAATFAFSGVVVSELYYSNFQPGVTLLPWALWALLRPVRSPAHRVVGSALVFGLLFLAGDVFSSGVAILCGVLWILFETPRGQRPAAAGALAAAVGLGALLAAPQILATALLVPETHRAVIGMKLAESFHFSLSPWRLLELAVPYPFGPVWSQDLFTIWGESAFRFFFATLYARRLRSGRGRRAPARRARRGRAVRSRAGFDGLTAGGRAGPGASGHARVGVPDPAALSGEVLRGAHPRAWRSPPGSPSIASAASRRRGGCFRSPRCLRRQRWPPR